MDHRINLKEYAKNDKYLDLARELKKLWNMKVTIVPIVIDWHSQICLGPYQHTPKKGWLRCQAIKLALVKRVRAWGDSLLRLEAV